jgi:hypothetical protein
MIHRNEALSMLFSAMLLRSSGKCTTALHQDREQTFNKSAVPAFALRAASLEDSISSDVSLPMFLTRHHTWHASHTRWQHIAMSDL